MTSPPRHLSFSRLFREPRKRRWLRALLATLGLLLGAVSFAHAAAIGLDPARPSIPLAGHLSALAIQPPAQEFARHAAQEGNLQGMVYGLLLLALLFNLTFRAGLKEAVHRAYTLHLAALGLSLAAANGDLHQYLPPAWPSANDRLIYLATLLLIATSSWCFAAFVNLDRHFPRLDRLLRGLAGGALLAAIPALFGDFPRLAPPLFVAVAVLAALGSLILLRLCWRRAPGPYLAAFAALILGALGIALRNLGLLTPGLLVNNALQIGAAIHIVILHLALAQRMRDAERDKLQAQVAALASSHRTAQELEQQIRQRTAELSASNRALRRHENELREAKEHAAQVAACERQMHEEERHLLELLAHEFRSPLAIIGNTAQTLRRLKEGDEQLVRSKGERIFGAVSRLAHLIDNCLSEARLNSLDRPLQPEAVTLADCLQRVAAPYQHDMHHRWRIDLPRKPLRVHADPILLELALSNLCENAAKYAPTGSEIHLSTSFDSHRVSIEVRDQGPGIAAELQAEIFKKFIRGNSPAPGNAPPGAGLGLYLVKRIALLHGGDVSLDSAPGKGCRFTLWLPMS